jgi:hypothetical protein
MLLNINCVYKLPSGQELNNLTLQFSHKKLSQALNILFPVLLFSFRESLTFKKFVKIFFLMRFCINLLKNYEIFLNFFFRRSIYSSSFYFWCSWELNSIWSNCLTKEKFVNLGLTCIWFFKMNLIFMTFLLPKSWNYSFE